MTLDLFKEAELAQTKLQELAQLDPEATNLISQMLLAQALFALWDNGFYELVERRPDFALAEAADELQVDAHVLEIILDYLTGRGLVGRTGERLHLTERGKAYHNVVLRGLVTLYCGGYNGVVSQLAP